jgi:hypothetical protein
MAYIKVLYDNLLGGTEENRGHSRIEQSPGQGMKWSDNHLAMSLMGPL